MTWHPTAFQPHSSSHSSGSGTRSRSTRPEGNPVHHVSRLLLDHQSQMTPDCDMHTPSADCQVGVKVTDDRNNSLSLTQNSQLGTWCSALMCPSPRMTKGLPRHLTPDSLEMRLLLLLLPSRPRPHPPYPLTFFYLPKHWGPAGATAQGSWEGENQ